MERRPRNGTAQPAPGHLSPCPNATATARRAGGEQSSGGVAAEIPVPGQDRDADAARPHASGCELRPWRAFVMQFATFAGLRRRTDLRLPSQGLINPSPARWSRFAARPKLVGREFAWYETAVGCNANH